MNSRMKLNLLIFFMIYHIIIFYIGWNGWVWLNSFFQVNHIYLYSLTIAFLAYSYFLSRMAGSLTILKIIGSYWMAIVQYAIIFLPLADVSVFFMRLSAVSQEKSIFWTGIFIAIAYFLIFAYGSFNAFIPLVRKYEIKIPKKAGRFQRLRMVMASDMHFGTLSGKAHLQRLVKKVNELKPDIILFPGDIIDDDPAPFIQKGMGEVMKTMKAPLGVFGVLGNHEYYGGKIPEFLEQMNRIDVKILLDEVIKIHDSFYLIGRRDRSEKKRKSLQDLMNGLDETLPLIMMDHQPYELGVAEDHGIDVLLSGHTHRGQLAPNHLITQKIYELDWGYKLRNQLHVFVSSGFGFWGPPLRIGSRSEVLQIDIEFE